MPPQSAPPSYVDDPQPDPNSCPTTAAANPPPEAASAGAVPDGPVNSAMLTAPTQLSETTSSRLLAGPGRALVTLMSAVYATMTAHAERYFPMDEDEVAEAMREQTERDRHEINATVLPTMPTPEALAVGSTVALWSDSLGKRGTGYFVMMDSDFNLVRNPDQIPKADAEAWIAPEWRAWERFTVVDAGGGEIALHNTHHNRFIRITHDGKVNGHGGPCAADALPPAEKWGCERLTVVNRGDGTFALHGRCANRFMRRHMGAGKLDTAERTCDADKLPNGWVSERFHVFPLPSAAHAAVSTAVPEGKLSRWPEEVRTMVESPATTSSELFGESIGIKEACEATDEATRAHCGEVASFDSAPFQSHVKIAAKLETFAGMVATNNRRMEHLEKEEEFAEAKSQQSKTFTKADEGPKRYNDEIAKVDGFIAYCKDGLARLAEVAAATASSISDARNVLNDTIGSTEQDVATMARAATAAEAFVADIAKLVPPGYAAAGAPNSSLKKELERIGDEVRAMNAKLRAEHRAREAGASIAAAQPAVARHVANLEALLGMLQAQMGALAHTEEVAAAMRADLSSKYHGVIADMTAYRRKLVDGLLRLAELVIRLHYAKPLLTATRAVKLAKATLERLMAELQHLYDSDPDADLIGAERQVAAAKEKVDSAQRRLDGARAALDAWLRLTNYGELCADSGHASILPSEEGELARSADATDAFPPWTTGSWFPAIGL